MLMDEWEELVKVRWDKESQTNPKQPDRVSTNNRQKNLFLQLVALQFRTAAKETAEDPVSNMPAIWDVSFVVIV